MESRKLKLTSHQGRPFIPYVVLFAGLLFTAVVAHYLRQLSQAEDEASFRAAVHQVDASIQGRIETYVALLRAGTALFSASESVQIHEFRRFVEGLSLKQQYPGIQGIGFTARIAPEDKQNLIQTMRRVRPSFNIWPEYEREEYHSIIYLEPLDERNQVAIGYDMYSEPVRRAAMERARDTGAPVATRRVTLVQEIDPQTKQPGFLIYAPVYRDGSTPTTVEERQAELYGFVYSPFRVYDFLQGIRANINVSGIDYQVYDGSEATSEYLLFDSRKAGDDYQPSFTATTKLAVPGHEWNLTFTATPDFDPGLDHRFVSYTVASGVFISLLFFGASLSQTRARAAAERFAADLQESEAKVRHTLAEREWAEAALVESEERYRELVENANDIVYTLELDGLITSVNKAGELITGYSQEELLNRNLADLLTPESAEQVQQLLDRKFGGLQRVNYELEVKSKDGRILTLEMNSRLVRKGEELLGVQGIARDITARRRAEEALREADQRAITEYERLLERISSLAQALGTSRDLLTIFRALKEFTLASVPADGLFVSLYDRVRDERTACYCWGDGMEHDVSELPPMRVATGPNSRAIRTGQVIITEDYMKATRGHPGVIVGPDNGLRPSSSMVIPMAVMGRIVGTIEVQSYEVAAFREEHATAMRMAANLTAVALENVRLLERESSARAAAEESNRLKDEFLATVSHELRTPLTAILGWSRMLEAGSLGTPMAARAIETIRRNAKTQSQIIDDILDVSRIITGNLNLDLHPIELGPVIEAAINVVRPTADAKGIQVECDFEDRPNVISGDGNRLQQVIWNLLSNAIKFTPTGGRVKVSLKQVNAYVEIMVADTGQGIGPDFLPYVFDRFRQEDSTTTRRHGGLGLGLAIARHLVEIHGGMIQAHSDGDGKGATFTVRLPLVGIASQVEELKVDEEDQMEASLVLLNDLHILLVDDDVDTLELISAALRQRDARVTAVSSASQALEAIAKSVPDVLVSDIAMPDEDGYELLARVRALHCEVSCKIPAVAITAYARDEDRQRALSCGFADYLAKPIELAELIAAVANAAKRVDSPGQ
ncbi:MAG TPA: CHASE domain-containing protein [Pyrinomonadaceae bacterium]|nr:CHASE domain-containing protein [Pyrinomonadaceae bacterium]